MTNYELSTYFNCITLRKGVIRVNAFHDEKWDQTEIIPLLRGRVSSASIDEAAYRAHRSMRLRIERRKPNK